MKIFYLKTIFYCVFMKTFYHNKMFLLLALSSICTYGQGILKGIVTDSLSLEQLKGTEIILTGTNFSTVSDVDGEFNIFGIPAGEYILKASYLGYQAKNILVTVKPKETQFLNVELLADITNGNEVILTDQAKSQAEATNLQIKTNTIKNVISGKKLKDLPDENISTILNRLPGVSILNKSAVTQSFFKLTNSYQIGGSGEYQIALINPPQDDLFYADDPVPRILIRGLDSKYSNITIDGIRIPPTSVKDKSIDLNIIPERIFQNIELRKTITPDEDADATAGSINILTGKAPYKRKIKAVMLGNYNRFDRAANQYNFTGSYGERFFDNLLGIQANADVEKKILSSEYEKNGINILPVHLYTNTVRERYEASLLLDFNTPDGGSIKFNNFLNQINTDYFENKVDSLVYIRHVFNDRKTEQKVFLSSIEGNNYLFGFNVDWNVVFSESGTDHPFFYSLYFYGSPPHLEYTIDNPSKNYCKEKNVSINIKKNYSLGNEFTGELKFGGKYRINSRSFYEDWRVEIGSLYGYNKSRKLADGSFVKKDFSGTRFDGLLGKTKSQVLLLYFQDDPPGECTIFDKYTIPLVNKDALRLWRQLNFNEYYTNDGADINSYDFSESVFAGYVMHQLSLGQWVKFLTGLRIENEHNNYSGYYFPEAIIDPTDIYNSLPLQTDKYQYDKVTMLPNFQMFIQPADFLNLRMATYKTLIRPDCYARMPKVLSVAVSGFGQNGASSGNYLNIGNPDLKNADVWNYEFQTQFHGNGIGLFSINAFLKNINGMQQEINGTEISGISTLESLGINWDSLPANYPFKKNSYYYLYTYFNSAKPTRIWGFEIEHQANFRYLPWLFKNIVLNYNLTFLRSETWKFDLTKIATTTTQYLIADKIAKLDNVPEFFANVILGYDIKGFSFRISYFYQDIYPLENFYSNEVKENELSRLDIALRQQIIRKISIILNLNNITNTKEETIMVIPGSKYNPVEKSETLQAYRYGMNVDFGVMVNL